MIYIKREGNGICPVFMIQFETGKNLIELFGESLPPFLYSEVLDICQDFGFIEGEKIVVEENLTLTESEIQKLISPARTSHASLTLIESRDILTRFFLKLQTLSIDFFQFGPSKTPYGIFRFSSIYDFSVQYLNYTLEDLLDYLYINLQEQKKLFGNSFEEQIIENSGLPYDDLRERNTLYFSNKNHALLQKEIAYKGVNYPLHIRIVPGTFPGIDFIISINTGNLNNIALNVAVRFEKILNSIVPIIHVMQSPYLDLWAENGILTSTPRNGIDYSMPKKNLFPKPMLYEFCESVVQFLEYKGYDTVYFIAKHEMLWIMEHIQDDEVSRNKIISKYSEAHQFITNEENSFSERKRIVYGKFTKHLNDSLCNYSFGEDCLSALKKISHTF